MRWAAPAQPRRHVSFEKQELLLQAKAAALSRLFYITTLRSWPSVMIMLVPWCCFIIIIIITGFFDFFGVFLCSSAHRNCYSFLSVLQQKPPIPPPHRLRLTCGRRLVKVVIIIH